MAIPLAPVRDAEGEPGRSSPTVGGHPTGAPGVSSIWRGRERPAGAMPIRSCPFPCGRQASGPTQSRPDPFAWVVVGVVGVLGAAIRPKLPSALKAPKRQTWSCSWPASPPLASAPASLGLARSAMVPANALTINKGTLTIQYLFLLTSPSA